MPLLPFYNLSFFLVCSFVNLKCSLNVPFRGNKRSVAFHIWPAENYMVNVIRVAPSLEGTSLANHIKSLKIVCFSILVRNLAKML